MGQTAENVVEAENVSREEMDEWGARSQQRAVEAQESGYFDREITPVTLADGTLLDSRGGGLAQAMVGFDDELPQAAARIVIRARTSLRGAVEVGGIGVGRWTVTAGGTSTSFELTSSGGFGADANSGAALAVGAGSGSGGGGAAIGGEPASPHASTNNKTER